MEFEDGVTAVGLVCRDFVEEDKTLYLLMEEESSVYGTSTPKGVFISEELANNAADPRCRHYIAVVKLNQRLDVC